MEEKIRELQKKLQPLFLSAFKNAQKNVDQNGYTWLPNDGNIWVSHLNNRTNTENLKVDGYLYKDIGENHHDFIQIVDNWGRCYYYYSDQNDSFILALLNDGSKTSCGNTFEIFKSDEEKNIQMTEDDALRFIMKSTAPELLPQFEGILIAPEFN
ncbi:MAG: hypothetical protein LBN07_04215 [Christensenellaceae bacterium]|nr:hypothetical protein [Christensenellaceae bacterium]